MRRQLCLFTNTILNFIVSLVSLFLGISILGIYNKEDLYEGKEAYGVLCVTVFFLSLLTLSIISFVFQVVGYKKNKEYKIVKSLFYISSGIVALFYVVKTTFSVEDVVYYLNDSIGIEGGMVSYINNIVSEIVLSVIFFTLYLFVFLYGAISPKKAKEIKPKASTKTLVQRLMELESLKEDNVITEEEFNKLKQIEFAKYR